MAMSKGFSGIYENGVFRPLDPVHLPEHTPVWITPTSAPGGGEGIRATAGAWTDAEAELEEWVSRLNDMRRQGRSVITPNGPAS
jgi:predicted DNA-binding antitoxin AbrB/MazE fold protein